MAQVGRINKLTVKGRRDYGLHLDGGGLGDILLPTRYVPHDCQPGDELEVFIYVDREDRLRATTRKPKATVGQFACLEVVENTSSGAYLDWGLDLDLFVPKSEQQGRMEEGKFYVVFVFLDKQTRRITASSKLDRFLDRQRPEYKEGEEVDLVIYDKTELGYKALVNFAHEGMLYDSEVFLRLTVGQQLKGYIKKIREDHKIDLALQQPGYQGVDDISLAILEIIKEQGGSIAVTDKSKPEEIYALFGVSKKNFKKAIGALYRKRLITIDSAGVRLVG